MHEYIYMAVTSVLVLAILIFVHELGHFLIAKLCKVGVVEFAIGFGKKIYQRKYGETYYSLRAIPLGGYVRMVGDDPSQVFSGAEEKPEASGEALIRDELAIDQELLSDKSKWFLNKGVPAKAAIVLAGPAFNMIFALVLSIGTYAVYGKVESVNEAVIGDVFPGFPAEAAGLRSKDLVVSVNGVAVSTWQELSGKILNSDGGEIALLVKRQEDGQEQLKEIKVIPTADTSELSLLDDSPAPQSKPKQHMIGIRPDTFNVPATLQESLLLGSGHVWYLTRLTFRLLGAIVQGAVNPRKVVGGPIAVFTGAAQSAKRGLESLFQFMVLLSVSLAVFNLLPIPILDGGHLMFFLIEAIKGSPVSIRWQTLANQVGMVLLLALMVFAVSNDVIRFF
ncbi:MAG: RIP metalloprotease RseP [Proteobacteria bacterium]|nr:MAG: RIP metalloprotease RseP [Pseudomonadota bacterium]